MKWLIWRWWGHIVFGLDPVIFIIDLRMARTGLYDNPWTGQLILFILAGIINWYMHASWLGFCILHLFSGWGTGTSVFSENKWDYCSHLYLDFNIFNVLSKLFTCHISLVTQRRRPWTAMVRTTNRRVAFLEWRNHTQHNPPKHTVKRRMFTHANSTTPRL